jgi:hypothetical protein
MYFHITPTYTIELQFKLLTGSKSSVQICHSGVSLIIQTTDEAVLMPINTQAYTAVDSTVK